MASEEKIATKVWEPKELRVFGAPGEIHAKIEKYMSIVHATEGRVLLKPDAILELLYGATKHITLP